MNFKYLIYFNGERILFPLDKFFWNLLKNVFLTCKSFRVERYSINNGYNGKVMEIDLKELKKFIKREKKKKNKNLEEKIRRMIEKKIKEFESDNKNEKKMASIL